MFHVFFCSLNASLCDETDALLVIIAVLLYSNVVCRMAVCLRRVYCINNGVPDPFVVGTVASCFVFFAPFSFQLRGMCHRSEAAEETIDDLTQVYDEGDLVKAVVLQVMAGAVMSCMPRTAVRRRKLPACLGTQAYLNCSIHVFSCGFCKCDSVLIYFFLFNLERQSPNLHLEPTAYDVEYCVPIMYHYATMDGY